MSGTRDNHLETASNYQGAMHRVKVLAEVLNHLDVYDKDSPDGTADKVDALSAAIIAMCDQTMNENEV